MNKSGLKIVKCEHGQGRSYDLPNGMKIKVLFDRYWQNGGGVPPKKMRDREHCEMESTVTREKLGLWVPDLWLRSAA